MATLTFNGESFAVDHAVKGADYIHGYDANGVLIVAFDGVTDFAGFIYDGTYMEPRECLTEHCNTVRYCGGALKTLDGKVVMLTSPSEEEEWANPPMLDGVEYRTTMRFDGKVVYAKAVSCGSLPNNTSKTVATNITYAKIVGVESIVKSADGVVGSMPYVSTSFSILARYNVNASGSISVVTSADMTKYSAIFKLYYTKD